MTHPVWTCAQWDDVRAAVEQNIFCMHPPDPITIYSYHRAVQTSSLIN
uniref:Uncharacterized protein n=1 Tax=Arundo donax TaxID=35708 RepID=A0A0A9C3Z3_ARUDO